MRTVVPIACALLVYLVTPTAAQRIVLDPGHGGADPGAVGCGLQEAPIVLDVALRTATLLRGAGFTVDLTRSDDRSVSLSARTDFANSRGADRFVSIHANSNAGTPATGTETFAYTSPGSTALDLRDRVQEEMIDAWGLRDRGGKLANFHVVRETTMPAAISEAGFINNCEIDARYLGDAGRRAEMAEAHYRAVVRHYGRTPGSVEPPMPAVGSLVGVVFEDAGRGVEDTSARVGGAQISLEGRPERVTSEATTGGWSFSLAPGSYTVVVSGEGYETNRRACDVAAGGETWCSVGLVRVGVSPTPDDAGTTTSDAGVALGDAGLGDASTDPAMRGDAGEGADGGTLVPPERELVAGGCAAGGGPVGELGWLALLATLLARRVRRRRPRARSPLKAVSLAFLAACGTSEVTSQRAGLLDETRVQARIEPATTVSALATLEEVARLLPDRRFAAVEIAPRGDRFALSGLGFATLAWSDGTDLHPLAEGPARGFAPVWRADGEALGVRTVGQSETAVPHLAVGLDGAPVAPVVAADGALAWAVGDEVVRVEVGDVRRDVRLPGDRVFAPRLSPDRRWVVFRGLSTGLYAHELVSERTLHLGAGGHARFDAGSGYVVFERVLDDGHEVTEASLWVADLERGQVAPLRAPRGLETSPSISRDGRVAWLVDGELHVGRLRLH